MKAFIFDPLWDELVTDGLSAKLKDSGLDLVVIKRLLRLVSAKNYLKVTKNGYSA